MKTLREIINEKLLINKNIQNQLITVGKIDINIRDHIRMMLSTTSPRINYQDEEKMKAYHDKGSNPTRLVNSIKDLNKLWRRWLVAVKMEWDDAIKIFGDEIVNREHNMTIDNLHEYINYLNGDGNKRYSKDYCEHYFDLYGIDYKKGES